MAKEIATGLGLTLLICLVALHLPLFGFFAALFLPLPTLYYRVKLGRRPGGLIPGIAAAALTAAAGPATADAGFFVALLLLGFLLGESIEWRLPVEATVAGSGSLVLVSGVAVLLLAGALSGRGALELVHGYIGHNLEVSLELYRAMGMPEENVRLIAEAKDRIAYVLVRLLPALTLTTLLVVAWANLLLARGVLVRRGLPFPEFGPLDRWRAPEGLVWGVIAAGILLLVPARGLKLVGVNVLMVLMTVYFFQGIAIVAFFFDKKGFPRPVRVFLYSLLALQQVLLLAVIGLGFFDMWFNFRRLGTSAPR